MANTTIYSIVQKKSVITISLKVLMQVSVYKRNFPQSWAIQYTSLMLCLIAFSSPCAIFTLCEHLKNNIQKCVYAKIKTFVWTSTAPVWLNFIKTLVSILYSNLYILSNIFNKKEFRCISDKIIALLTMSMNRILVIGIYLDDYFFPQMIQFWYFRGN